MTLLLTIIVFFLSNKTRKGEIEKIVYMKNIFGQIHKSPNIHAQALSTISCGHPIEVLGRDAGSDEWFHAKTGIYEGYVQADQTVDKRPSCFQKKYSKFFDKMELGPTDFYRWGKLHTLFLRGASKAGQ